MFFKSYKKRVFVFAVVSSLLISRFTLAKEKKIGINNILIPPKAGIIKDTYDAGSDKTVIYIQDAHCVYSVQKNIVSLIDLLDQDYGISFVASEGVSDKVDALEFRSFPFADTRNYVSDIFMRKGLISGAEYLSITDEKGFVLWGIDDPELYRKNLDAYKSLLSIRQEGEELIDACSSHLLIIGQHIYSSEFKKFNLDRRKYEQINDKSNIKLYTGFLKDFAQKQKIDLDKYNHFNQFFKCIEAKEKIDYHGVETDYSQVHNLILENIPKDRRNEFLKKDLFAKINRIPVFEFYNYINQIADEFDISLENYKNFQQYYTYLQDIDKLHYGELLKQCRDIEQEIAFSFLNSPVQKDCYLYSRAIDILGIFLILIYQMKT